MLYAYELDRRLAAAGADLASIAFDPGLIVATSLMRTAPPMARRLMGTAPMKWLMKTTGVTMGSLPFSGGALADVAIATRFADASGTYVQSRNGRLVEARSSKASYDEASARTLWADSEALVHLAPEERPTMCPVPGLVAGTPAMAHH